MNPAQRRALADTLARLVSDGELTEEQAITIYQLTVDDGRLLDNVLPLPPYEGISQPAAADDWPDAIWLILAVAIGMAPGRSAVAQVIDFAPQSVRQDAADMLQEWHADSATKLARDLSMGRISVAEFQRRMRALNDQHNATHAALGAGTRHRAMSAYLAEQATLQAAYLQRFADRVAGGLLAARAGIAGLSPLSLGQLTERAALYGGIGRAIFFRAFEQHRQVDGEGNRAGWVIYYQSRDDSNTCSNCLEAQGYYLPGQGPYPGQVCLGRHHCRCRRVVMYDPAIYASLTGTPLTAGQPTP